MEQEIKSLFFELGMPVIQKDVQVSPRYTTIHYNLVHLNQYNEINKKAKFISAYIHKDIIVQKSQVGHFAIQIPNNEKKNVEFYGEYYKKALNNGIITERSIFAGVNDNNEPIFMNLDSLPHILVAGTTGSGKSVMLNNIICCLLRNFKNIKPQFHMIDTKRVELSSYKKIDKCSMVTESEDAVEVLDDVCRTIDARYKIMEENEWRIIPEYVERVIVVIEELGDLMAISKKAVEQYIVKIARLGRACGVHLVIATQRPTTDVVTGEIKANIGCRFALQTTSGIDSRNILGHNGAEKLKGNGDCLLKLPSVADEIHLQCPYISDDDIQKTIKEFLEKE